jgi:type I restriction enzyme, R subunit
LAALEALVGDPKRIALVTEDFVGHWEARYAAMLGKAMVVCMSRRICVELYKAIQKLRPAWHHDDDDKGVVKSVMAASASDKLEWQQHIRSKTRREELAKAFKNPKKLVRIVIVRDIVADRLWPMNNSRIVTSCRLRAIPCHQSWDTASSRAKPPLVR